MPGEGRSNEKALGSCRIGNLLENHALEMRDADERDECNTPAAPAL